MNIFGADIEELEDEQKLLVLRNLDFFTGIEDLHQKTEMPKCKLEKLLHELEEEELVISERNTGHPDRPDRMWKRRINGRKLEEVDV
jgi:hypothetical protein